MNCFCATISFYHNVFIEEVKPKFKRLATIFTYRQILGWSVSCFTDESAGCSFLPTRHHSLPPLHSVISAALYSTSFFHLSLSRLHPSLHLFLTSLLRTLPPRSHLLVFPVLPVFSLFVSQTEYLGAVEMGPVVCEANPSIMRSSLCEHAWAFT